MRAFSTYSRLGHSWQAHTSRVAAGALIASALVAPSAGIASALEPDSTPPVATITAPAADPVVSVEVGAALAAAFACDDPAGDGQVVSGIAAAEGCVGVVVSAGADASATPLAAVADGDALPTGTAGSFELRVTATDAAGLTGQATVTYTVTAVPAQPNPDTTRPTAEITSPAAGTGLETPVGADLVAEYACADPASPQGELTSGLASCVGEVLPHNAPEGTAPIAAVASGDKLGTSTPGSFDLRVTATDKSGLTGLAIRQFNVVAPPAASDSAAPSISITSPADGATFTVGDAVTADFACADEEGGSGVGSCSGTVADGSPLDTSAPGSFTFTVTAKDVAGNEAAKSTDYTVAAAPVADTRAPTITISSPTSGASVAAGTSMLAEWTCADETDATVPVCSGVVARDGGEPVAVASGAPLDLAEHGAYVLSVRAVDTAGNEATATRSFTVAAPPVEFAQVTGVVRDTAGNPLADAKVIARNAGTSTVAASTASRVGGTYALTLVPGSYDFQIIGPAGSGLGAVAPSRSLETGTEVMDWTIGKASVRFSGRVSDARGRSWAGTGFSNAYVQMLRSGQNMAQAFVGEDGSFSVDVVPGVYQLTIWRTWNGNGYQAATTSDFSIDSDRVVDLVLPTADVDVSLVGSDGTAAEGRVEMPPWCYAPSGVMAAPGIELTTLMSYGSSQTAEGQATLRAFQGPSCMVKVTPNDGPTFTQTVSTSDSTNSATIYVSSGISIPGTPVHLADGDNVSPVIETQVPSLGGSGTGDGNGDGTPDAQQENVTSLPVLGSTDPGASAFVTVAAPEATKLTNVYTSNPSTLQATNTLPTGATLPEGLTAFKVDLPASQTGKDVTISIYTGSTSGVVGYAKFTPDAAGGPGTWSLLPNDRVTIYPNRVEVRLTDGGIGDADGVANGVIDDPGGPVIIPDTTPPTITINGVTEGGSYAKGTATPGCTATDDGAGVDGRCSGTLTGGDANGLGTFTYTATAVDFARNRAEKSVTFKVVNPDTTPPVVTGKASAQPNANGWYKGDVTVAWTASDPAPSSGGVTNPSATRVTGEGANLTATSDKVCDAAGNCAVGTVTGLKVDRTAPTLVITGATATASPPELPTYVLGAAPTLKCTATDGLSGVDGQCVGTQTGGNANGVGTFTYTATASDRAGNTATATYSYRVIYRVDGFLQPINDPDLSPGTAPSVFKAGWIIPAIVQIKRADGKLVQPVETPKWITPIKGNPLKASANEAQPDQTATTDGTFCNLLGFWTHAWLSPGSAAGYWYTIGVKLDDGTVRTVVIGLK